MATSAVVMPQGQGGGQVIAKNVTARTSSGANAGVTVNVVKSSHGLVSNRQQQPSCKSELQQRLNKLYDGYNLIINNEKESKRNNDFNMLNEQCQCQNRQSHQSHSSLSIISAANAINPVNHQASSVANKIAQISNSNSNHPTPKMLVAPASSSNKFVAPNSKQPRKTASQPKQQNHIVTTTSKKTSLNMVTQSNEVKPLVSPSVIPSSSNNSSSLKNNNCKSKSALRAASINTNMKKDSVNQQSASHQQMIISSVSTSTTNQNKNNQISQNQNNQNHFKSSSNQSKSQASIHHYNPSSASAIQNNQTHFQNKQQCQDKSATHLNNQQNAALKNGTINVKNNSNKAAVVKRAVASSLKSPKFVQINLKMFNNFVQSSTASGVTTNGAIDVSKTTSLAANQSTQSNNTDIITGQNLKKQQLISSSKSQQRLISKQVFSQARQMAKEAATLASAQQLQSELNKVTSPIVHPMTTSSKTINSSKMGSASVHPKIGSSIAQKNQAAQKQFFTTDQGDSRQTENTLTECKSNNYVGADGDNLWCKKYPKNGQQHHVRGHSFNTFQHNNNQQNQNQKESSNTVGVRATAAGSGNQRMTAAAVAVTSTQTTSTATARKSIGKVMEQHLLQQEKQRPLTSMTTSSSQVALTHNQQNPQSQILQRNQSSSTLQQSNKNINKTTNKTKTSTKQVIMVSSARGVVATAGPLILQQQQSQKQLDYQKDLTKDVQTISSQDPLSLQAPDPKSKSKDMKKLNQNSKPPNITSMIPVQQNSQLTQKLQQYCSAPSHSDNKNDNLETQTDREQVGQNQQKQKQKTKVNHVKKYSMHSATTIEQRPQAASCCDCSNEQSISEHKKKRNGVADGCIVADGNQVAMSQLQGGHGHHRRGITPTRSHSAVFTTEASNNNYKGLAAGCHSSLGHALGPKIAPAGHHHAPHHNRNPTTLSSSNYHQSNSFIVQKHAENVLNVATVNSQQHQPKQNNIQLNRQNSSLGKVDNDQLQEKLKRQQQQCIRNFANGHATKNNGRSASMLDLASAAAMLQNLAVAAEQKNQQIISTEKKIAQFKSQQDIFMGHKSKHIKMVSQAQAWQQPNLNTQNQALQPNNFNKVKHVKNSAKCSESSKTSAIAPANIVQPALFFDHENSVASASQRSQMQQKKQIKGMQTSQQALQQEQQLKNYLNQQQLDFFTTKVKQINLTCNSSMRNHTPAATVGAKTVQTTPIAGDPAGLIPQQPILTKQNIKNCNPARDKSSKCNCSTAAKLVSQASVFSSAASANGLAQSRNHQSDNHPQQVQVKTTTCKHKINNNGKQSQMQSAKPIMTSHSYSGGNVAMMTNTSYDAATTPVVPQKDDQSIKKSASTSNSCKMLKQRKQPTPVSAKITYSSDQQQKRQDENTTSATNKKINSMFEKINQIQLNLSRIGHEYNQQIKTIQQDNNSNQKMGQNYIKPHQKKSFENDSEDQDWCEETGRSLETVAMLQESFSYNNSATKPLSKRQHRESESSPLNPSLDNSTVFVQRQSEMFTNQYASASIVNTGDSLLVYSNQKKDSNLNLDGEDTNSDLKTIEDQSSNHPTSQSGLVLVSSQAAQTQAAQEEDNSGCINFFEQSAIKQQPSVLMQQVSPINLAALNQHQQIHMLNNKAYQSSGSQAVQSRGQQSQIVVRGGQQNNMNNMMSSIGPKLAKHRRQDSSQVSSLNGSEDY